jgi:hypothetical protein
MQDLQLLLPHSKKDVKLDTKNDRGVINEVADMKVREGEGGVRAEAALSAPPASALQQ